MTRPIEARIGRYIEVPVAIGERARGTVGPDATGVDAAAEPFRQAATDRNQRTISGNALSVNGPLFRERANGCGYENVFARERDGRAIRRMQAPAFDVPCFSTVAARAESNRGGGDNYARTDRVRAHLMNVAVDGNGRLPGCAAVRRTGEYRRREHSRAERRHRRWR